jgi:hypothetical protein
MSEHDAIKTERIDTVRVPRALAVRAIHFLGDIIAEDVALKGFTRDAEEIRNGIADAMGPGPAAERGGVQSARG